MDKWIIDWQQYLDENISAQMVVDSCLQACSRNAADNDQMMKSLPGNDRRVERHSDRVNYLAQHLRGDLVELTERGANPRVLMEIVFRRSDFAMPAEFPTGFYDRDAEIKELSSSRYWEQMLLKLERTRDSLRDFMGTGLYNGVAACRLWEHARDQYPFARVCHEIGSVEGVIEMLASSIRRAGLDRPDRQLKDDAPSVEIEVTSGKRGQKRGGGPEFDWDRIALMLYQYVRNRTGKPQYRRIARMLHFGGHECFPGVTKPGEDSGKATDKVESDEIDRIRKRMEKLKGRKDLVSSVGMVLCQIEEKYETREVLDFGGGVWRKMD